jgi:hypothetical protein
MPGSMIFPFDLESLHKSLEDIGSEVTPLSEYIFSATSKLGMMYSSNTLITFIAVALRRGQPQPSERDGVQ